MARSLSGKPNVTAPGGDYPLGRIKDDSGAGDGTPVNELVYGDIHQFFAKLMDIAAVAPNELPDNNADGFQLIEALLKRCLSNVDNKGIKTKVFAIGAWDMNISASGTARSFNHNVNYEKIVSVQCIVRNDGGNIRRSLEYTDHVASLLGGNITIDAVNITLRVIPGGAYDNNNYDDVAIDRGTVYVTYYE